MQGNHLLGSFLGMCGGFYTFISTSSNFPSKESMIQALILGAIGGIAGYLSVELFKLVKLTGKKLIAKIRKNDKTSN